MFHSLMAPTVSGLYGAVMISHYSLVATLIQALVIWLSEARRLDYRCLFW